MSSLLIASMLSSIEKTPDRSAEKLEAESRQCFPEIGSGQITFLLRFGFADPPSMRAGRMSWRASASGIEVTRKEKAFSYQEAFRRNIGLVSETEQELLRGKTIAIPGLGGVGGQHLITLARMGVGGFHLADADTFSHANFNRQHGANLFTLGKNKAEVMEEMVRAIN